MTLAAQFEIEYLQYLGPDGKTVRDDMPAFWPASNSDDSMRARCPTTVVSSGFSM